jgi:hypothetical protein
VKPMKRQAYYAMVLALLAIILTADGLVSHDYYVEDREVQGPDGLLKSNIGYGLRDVHNQSKLVFNGSTISKEDKYQDYQDFIGASNATRAMNAGSQQNVLMLVSLVLLVLFLPLVVMSHQGYFDERLGRMGPYIPLIAAQVAALLLIIGTLWFTYAFATGLDEDVANLHQERYQAVGGTTAFTVIVGGFLIQVAALMALSRTRLIYIKPLEEGKTPKPLE